MKQQIFEERQLNIRLGVLFPVVVLVLLLLGLVTGDIKYSDTEGRPMQGFPDISVESAMSGTLQTDTEQYLQDQFAGRDFFVNLRTGVSKILGRNEINGVYRSSDAYLIEAMGQPDAALTKKQTEAMNAFAERHDDINQYVIIVPTAAEILADKLPGNAMHSGESAYLENFKSLLGKKLMYIDVSKTLRNHKDEYIYYRTDSNWTTLGACYAYREAVAAMGLDNSMDNYEAIAVTENFQGNLHSLSGYGNGTRDTITVYFPLDSSFTQVVEYVDEQETTTSLYNSNALESHYKYDVFFGGDHPLIKINTTCLNNRKLLVFKDSYGNSFVPFLTPLFSEVVVVDPVYFYDDIDSVMKDEGITDVLYLYSTGNLATDTALVPVLENN